MLRSHSGPQINSMQSLLSRDPKLPRFPWFTHTKLQMVQNLVKKYIPRYAEVYSLYSANDLIFPFSSDFLSWQKRLNGTNSRYHRLFLVKNLFQKKKKKKSLSGNFSVWGDSPSLELSSFPGEWQVQGKAVYPWGGLKEELWVFIPLLVAPRSAGLSGCMLAHAPDDHDLYYCPCGVSGFCVHSSTT